MSAIASKSLLGHFSFLQYPTHQTIWNSKDRFQPIGWWGKTTSSIDWCELNYAITPYIAEFVNTLTNIGFIALSLHTIMISYQNQFPRRIILASLSTILVGLGSALFHGTLLFEFQLLDELPMIYATSIVTWNVFSLGPLDEKPNMLYPALILLYNIGFTWAYLTFPNPIFHQVCYAAMSAIMVGRIVQLFLTRIQNTKANLESRKLTLYAIVYAALAFSIWNLDNLFCDPLTSFKSKLPLLLSWLLEGHGWWHILMGFSIYNLNIAVAYLTLSIRDKEENYVLKKSWGGFIKRLERSEKGWKDMEKRRRNEMKGTGGKKMESRKRR